ncbi:helix-turn-helix domain-containing protein [Flavobacterium soyangense]|uniref:Helix-turn-helix transcriptional regulator n=1 Tax=Flavobacterium soyangense TaxID=2023265 RepID=A0A930XV35_9FLAO|nr:AraC family transcriptional regulator [Flavobacterium soyangense]MBF2707881.1 helix-turn-helix transcriptional regulator [Flavobacterium soyangense]
MEQIYQLPADFFGGNPSETNIYFYQTQKSSQKNKVVFNQNLICFLQEGNKEVYYGTENILLDNTKILLLQVGNTIMTEKTTDDNAYQSILLFFSDKFLIDFVAKYNIKLDQNATVNNPVIFVKDEYVSYYEKSLLFLSNTKDPGNKLTEAKINELLLYLIENKPAETINFIQNVVNRIKNVPFYKLINNNTNFNLTNEELAFLSNMSVSTFKRKFFETFSNTPKQYYIEQKMNQAMLLLQKKKRPSEIYFELGYENLSAFSNEFKKHFGVSPKNYSI